MAIDSINQMVCSNLFNCYCALAVRQSPCAILEDLVAIQQAMRRPRRRPRLFPTKSPLPLSSTMQPGLQLPGLGHPGAQADLNFASAIWAHQFWEYGLVYFFCWIVFEFKFEYSCIFPDLIWTPFPGTNIHRPAVLPSPRCRRDRARREDFFPRGHWAAQSPHVASRERIFRCQEVSSTFSTQYHIIYVIYMSWAASLWDTVAFRFQPDDNAWYSHLQVKNWLHEEVAQCRNGARRRQLPLQV